MDSTDFAKQLNFLCEKSKIIIVFKVANNLFTFLIYNFNRILLFIMKNGMGIFLIFIGIFMIKTLI